MSRLSDQMKKVFHLSERRSPASGRASTKPLSAQTMALTAVLEAANQAALSILSAHDPWDERFTAAMNSFGFALKASRLFVFENQTGPSSSGRASLRYCWELEGSPSMKSNPALQNLSLGDAGLKRWEVDLTEERTI